MKDILPVVRLEHVFTTYEGADKPIIRDVSLSVQPGEFVIVGGPNGAGKTTLLEAIAGMLPVTGGSVSVCGMNAIRFGVEVRRKLGYVIQNFDFHPYTPFTVEEVVLMGRYGQLGWFRRYGKEDLEAVRVSLNDMDLLPMKNQQIGKLSGGQQQKVLIAQSMVKNPDVILLDEPFSNLDIKARSQVCSLLRDLTVRGIAIILVSHAFDVLPECDIHVVVMNGGSIVHTKTCRPDEVHDTVRMIPVCG